MRNYLYIVYLNGIVWDSVNAPNIRVAKRRACKMVRSDEQTSSIKFRNLAQAVSVETVKSFLGR
jgi:hypothetical protein